MSIIQRCLWGLLLGTSGLWFMADTLWPEPFTYFSFRGHFVQYSGVIAMVSMSVVMLLALRLPWMEQRLRGLDKAYRLHKWLGITALIAGTAHWWMAQGSKWMVGWGWLEKPVRGPRGEDTRSALEVWLGGQRGLAEDVGEWAFYGAAILILVALITRIPYSFFRKTHNWLAVGYLVLVYHAFVLTDFEYWSQPIGWVLLLLMVPGALAGLWILAGRLGRRRRVNGKLISLEHNPTLDAVEGVVKLEDGWPGHRAGQFAFVCSNTKEGPHPYSLASHWDPQQKTVTFMVKALGDWTGQLKEHLQPGMDVTVEGPYGCFDFEDQQPRQIWVAAGIGVTPFIARLDQLANQPSGSATPVNFFYTAANMSPELISRLQSSAEAAGVALHLIETSTQGRLNAERLCQQVSEWQKASVWFCGPGGFGAALKADLVSKGLPAGHYHQELFEMR